MELCLDLRKEAGAVWKNGSRFLNLGLLGNSHRRQQRSRGPEVCPKVALRFALTDYNSYRFLPNEGLGIRCLGSVYATLKAPLKGVATPQ